ncbi:MAG: class I SAM-dependent RNA methyltransferase, partial [Lachnospiraceae bacterium]|nr:class I SAM-dependent RNA methyltransferase [Lachnospiraceae bacterium]
MKKGEEYEAIVERMDFPNRGVCFTDGKEIMVKNALPGQKIRLRISKKRSGRVEGRLLEVTEPSPQETDDPGCPAFGSCGSCLYRGFSEQAELAVKEGQVRRLLAAACPGDDLSWFEGILASPLRDEYRNKMEFSFGDAYKGGPLTLGMHCRGSFYDIVSAEDCRIVDEDIRMILRRVQAFCRDGGWPQYRRDHTGFLRNLLVRKAAATGEILVGLVTSTQVPEDWSDEAFLRAALGAEPSLAENAGLFGRITGVIHIWNDREADVIEDQGCDLLYGRPWIVEEVLGLRFRITPFSFFQTNTRGAEVLYSVVRDYVHSALEGGGAAGGPETGTPEGGCPDAARGEIFDLYSGTGTIAQILAPEFDHVTAVEIVPEAVGAAKENAAENGIENCEFLCGDVLKVVDELEGAPGVIILDPPRDGVHPKALPKILAFGARNIVYVSCKPTSLARDLPVMIEAGYRPVRGVCVDMFPGTGNVETVCLLSKLFEAKNHISVKVDMEEMDVTAAESKASYQEIQEW